MERRALLAGLLGLAVEPLVPRRTYSFIWAPPEPKIFFYERAVLRMGGEEFKFADVVAAEAVLERNNAQRGEDGCYVLDVRHYEASMRVWLPPRAFGMRKVGT